MGSSRARAEEGQLPYTLFNYMVNSKLNKGVVLVTFAMPGQPTAMYPCH